MKRTVSENELYTKLARRGDPSAFFALFGGHIRSLYAMQRSRGKDHRVVCDEGAQKVAAMYMKFIRGRPVNPQKWFAAGCGLRKFNASAITTSISIADAADYEKSVNAALNRAYSSRLERGSDGRGGFKSERPLLPYAVGSVVMAGLAAFLFFSESVLSVSFGRFGSEYRVSFPRMAERLWELSGLVRADDAAGAGSRALPQQAVPGQAPGAEAGGQP